MNLQADLFLYLQSFWGFFIGAHGCCFVIGGWQVQEIRKLAKYICILVHEVYPSAYWGDRRNWYHFCGVITRSESPECLTSLVRFLWRFEFDVGVPEQFGLVSQVALFALRFLRVAYLYI